MAEKNDLEGLETVYENPFTRSRAVCSHRPETAISSPSNGETQLKNSLFSYLFMDLSTDTIFSFERQEAALVFAR